MLALTYDVKFTKNGKVKFQILLEEVSVIISKDKRIS